MEKIIKNTVEIKAGKEQVWDMLINPEQTKKYMVVKPYQIGNQEVLYYGKDTMRERIWFS
ncbi:hypothetical protein [Sporocytophaga myxococcoides]|uniref:hypothetical protein n=1 Tax=Sporocytophaga myxococcoides TaxID=153721 RepID=UPI000412D077|nr:hypothetical protein [Sporocytophaga myxococcoides]